VEPTDVAKTPDIHKVAAMLSGILSFSSVIRHDAIHDLFELQSIGKAEHQPKLILPRVAFEL
jgi:hypothetical protein